MSELEKADKRIEKEVYLKDYKGPDRVVYADDKWKQIQEERVNTPKFAAMTGLPTFDACIEGFKKGQLVVLSGPPKNGKSQLCVSFTASFWDKYKCLWFQYELNYEEFLSRFPTNLENKIDFFLPNYVESGNLEWVEDRIIEAKQKQGVDIVFLDHLDFLRDPAVLKDIRGVSQNLASYVGSIVQRIKRIAIDNDVIIFLMTHIRKNEWTKDDLPSSEELRDTGQIAQLADIVLMIIRRRAPKKSLEVYEEARAMLGIMENRHNGKTKKIPLIYDPDTKLFIEDNYYGQGNQIRIEPDWNES